MKEIDLFCVLKVTEDFGTAPHPDPLIRGTDPRIRILIRKRIRTKISRIRNIASSIIPFSFPSIPSPFPDASSSSPFSSYLFPTLYTFSNVSTGGGKGII